jgi:hypothetical protein
MIRPGVSSTLLLVFIFFALDAVGAAAGAASDYSQHFSASRNSRSPSPRLCHRGNMLSALTPDL